MGQHILLFKEKTALQYGSHSFHQTHIWTLSKRSKTTKQKALVINLNNKLQGKSPYESQNIHGMSCKESLKNCCSHKLLKNITYWTWEFVKVVGLATLTGFSYFGVVDT